MGRKLSSDWLDGWESRQAEVDTLMKLVNGLLDLIDELSRK